MEAQVTAARQFAQLQLPMTEQKRLGRQLEAVRGIMLHPSCRSGWMTLSEIVADLWGMKIVASEAGVSARLRDLRKLGYTVEKRVRSGNLWEYRVER